MSNLPKGFGDALEKKKTKSNKIQPDKKRKKVSKSAMGKIA